MKTIKRVIRVYLIFSLITFLVGCGVPSVNKGCSPKTSISNIIGGQDVNSSHEWPWIVTISQNGQARSTHFCGGTLISSQYVLTAAHCVKAHSEDTKDSKASEIQVYIGARDLSSNDGVRYEVSEIIAHDTFGKSTGGDIALLKLKEKTNITPIQLVGQNETHLFNVGATSTNLGWGHRTETDNDISNILQFVDIPILDKTKCDFNNEGVQEDSVCAGGDEKGSCMGDSGGPLIVSDNGTYKLIGLVSHGKQICSHKDEPGVYTEVHSYLAWINEKTKSSENGNNTPTTTPTQTPNTQPTPIANQPSNDGVTPVSSNPCK